MKLNTTCVISKGCYLVTPFSVFMDLIRSFQTGPGKEDFRNRRMSDGVKETEERLQLNDAQMEAVTHGQGPAMVLAGPGSGKTMVITSRTRWLIRDMGVRPDRILVITFTRAAADEMKKRFQRFPGMDRAPVYFGTFHSVFFMILRYAYNYHAGSILREEERRAYIREMISEMELETEDENDFISNLLGEISYVKGEMMALSYFHSNVCSDDQFVRLARGYEKRIRQEKKIDFDDMLVFCYELLKNRQDILAMWRERFQYILIDEFQDINRVQYEVVKLLAGEKRNVFVVGDDDQSIYRFRGAKPELMQAFEKDFPESRRIILAVNYRCSREIVDAASILISHNEKRYPKDLTAARESGAPVVRNVFDDGSEESDTIVRGIRFYHDKGIPFSDMAVIYRTNTQPRQLVGRLMEFGIPFQMKDSIPNIFDHWIARDLMIYLRMSRGQMDRASFLRVMNRPKRYISRAMVTDSEVDLFKLKQQTYGKSWLYDKIDRLEMDLRLLGRMEPYAAIQYIRTGIGYEDYLNDYAAYRQMDADGLYEVLNEIHESARDYHSMEEWFSYIDQYGKELQKQKKNQRRESEGLTLTTMHSAKGLEYEVVFVIDINEGITPHRKAVKDVDLEEERRLFYVAMTRAKSYLFLYSVRELYRKEAQISRFLGEIWPADKEQSQVTRRRPPKGRQTGKKKKIKMIR